jgi:predicted  nucleic acid-binding Zn-ribbon protein
MAGVPDQLAPEAADAGSGDGAVRRVKELERQLVYERDQNRKRLAQVSQHLTGLRERMEEMRVAAEERRGLRCRVKELERQLLSAEGERDRLAERLEQGVRPPDMPLPGAEVIGRLTTLEQACASQETELAEVRGQADQLERELATAHEECALAQEQQRALKHELSDAQGQLADALAELAQARAETQAAVPVLPDELEWEDEDGPRSGAIAALPVGAAIPLRTGEMTDFEELPVYDRQEEPAAVVPEELNTVELSGVELESAIRARQPSAEKTKTGPTRRGRRNPMPSTASEPTTAAADVPSAAALARMALREQFPDIRGLRFERHVSSGDDFSVFEAREKTSRRPVTVRVLTGNHAAVDELGIDTLMLASHPNLVSALSFGVTPHGPHVVFERVSGETLEQWVQRVGPVPEHVALGVALQAVRGLRKAAFHECVHGDLSPRSVVMESTGRVRVDGVGIHQLQAKTESGPRDPGFAAPEVVRGESDPSAAADMYSLAAMLHFLVRGKPPFEGDLAQVRKRQQTATFPDPRQRGAQVSDGFVALLLTCGSADPGSRPAAWEEVLETIEGLLPHEEAEPQAPVPRSRVARLVAEHPIAVAVAACIPLVAIGLGLKLLLG